MNFNLSGEKYTEFSVAFFFTIVYNREKFISACGAVG